jgi:anthranilate synthase component 1
VKELSEYDFIYKTKKITNKKISAEELYKALYNNQKYCFLYESLENTGEIGRYSIIGGFPFIIFEAKNNNCKINHKGNIIRKKGNPFDILHSLLKLYKDYPEIPPFSGGAVGYISYDSIRYIEKIPDNNPENPKLPEQYFMFPSEIIIVDNKKTTIDIIIYGEDDDKINQKIENLYKRILNFDNKSDTNLIKKRDISTEFISNFNKEEFEKAVLKSKRYIKEGEIFQVVLSQRFEFKLNYKPFEIYKNLRIENPSPYMYYIRFNDLYILGSSPEILIRFKEGKAISRPIAGTRKRGKTDKEDKILEKELLSDEKEIAEHIMLVDLARNDIGRVCEFGSVKVNELMKIERYSKVMHIVSDITGKVKNGFDSIKLFKASFPAGTVTGSPKIRAMEIIDELEPIKRGLYAGGIGYFGFNGELDFCIAIRTIIIKGEKGYIQAGAGIVADSIPENEYIETLNKASALKSALTEEI